jgi:M6 family metalloprotease-like protein
LSSPAVAYGKVFFGSMDGKLYAVSQDTGSLVWSYDAAEGIASSPAVADNTVFFCTVGDTSVPSRDVYALDQNTGSKTWKKTIGSGNLVVNEGSPAVADGKVFLCGGDGMLYCLDEYSGNIIWTKPISGNIIGAPAVFGGKVFAASSYMLYALDMNTGNTIWTYYPRDPLRGNTVHGDKVFTCSGTKVIAVYESTGSVAWSRDFGSGIWPLSCPAVADGKVFVLSDTSDNKERVYALSESSGSILWSQNLGYYSSPWPIFGHSSPAVADGKVYVGSWDNSVYCLDEDSGSVIWSYTTGDKVLSSPAVSDGAVFVGSCDHKVYAFKDVVTTMTKISVIPSSIIDPSLGPGSTIVINVTVQDVVDLFCWQIGLSFDATVLSCTKAWYPSDNVFAGMFMVPLEPLIDNSRGFVWHGASLIGAYKFSGKGTLCQIEFKVLARGTSILMFSGLYDDTFLLNYDLDSIPLTVTDGYFDNSITVGMQVNLGIVPINTKDSAITQTKSYYEDIGRKLRDYFLEVSYNTLYVEFEVYHRNDGSWFSVPQTTAWYRESNAREKQFIEHAINSCDKIVDFKKYDYSETSGKGIIAFIPPTYLYSGTQGGGTGAVTYCNSGVNGLFNTRDDTTVDAIIVPETRMFEEQKHIRSLAHEFAHALGKLLITSVSGHSKDCEWLLPDSYARGNLDGYWDLMGLAVGTERVHLCSYNKEWLGWLKYKETRMGETYTVKSLVSLEYGGDILRYSYDDNFYILEVRTKSSDYSKWDTETLYSKVLAFYQVNIRTDQVDTINLVRTLTKTGTFPAPGAGVTFNLLSLSEQEAQVSIERFRGRNLVGAILDTFANILSGVRSLIPHEATEPVSLPDIDLHAYSKDGRHIGINYETGEYEIQIPGAIASGDLLNGMEWIFVPQDINVYFAVSAKDNAEFLSSLPEARALTDGLETYTLRITYYGSDENRYDSPSLTQQISAGNALVHPYTIVLNPDGTYSITVNEGQSLTTVTTWMTDSDFNNITSFRAVFTPDGKTGYYKLTATNPGQFYQNILVNNTGPISLNITITYDRDANFTFKGAKPIHIYADFNRNIDITSNCTLEENKITVYNIPPGGMAYVTIHLGYALKGTIWTKSQVKAWYSKHTFNATTDTDISSMKSSVTITSQ